MKSNKKYWNGLEDLTNDPTGVVTREQEFNQELPVEEQLSEETLGIRSNRRDFLKVFGFGITAATLAACVETPVRNAIPYVIKPENITPGVASWYASTCSACAAGCATLVKNRDGRPIKLEGNPNSPMNKGGLCSVGHGSLLSLYDSERLSGPMGKGNPIDWSGLDNAISSEMQALSEGGKVRFLTSTINSPTTLKLIGEFLAKFKDAQHIMYDAISYSAIPKANKKSFDKEVLPSYHFEKANVIVSFGADFLGTWISPVEYSGQFASRRTPGETMSKFIMFDDIMSLSGSNADLRVTVAASQQGLAVVNLYNAIAELAGKSGLGGAKLEVAGNAIQVAAKELWANKGKALVVCGSNDTAVQEVVNGINLMLESYGSTIDLDNPSFQAMGDDEKLAGLFTEMSSGEVDALFVYNCNPVYDLPNGAQFKEFLGKVKRFSCSFDTKLSETSEACTYVAADHHALESWNDYQPKAGIFSLSQPNIKPIFRTRAMQESLLKWIGRSETWYAYLKQNWESGMFSTVKDAVIPTAFWNTTVKNGVYTLSPAPSSPVTEIKSDLNSAAGTIAGLKTEGEFDLVAYVSPNIRDGRMANIPWLQELPDAITKVSWDNYITLPFVYAKEKGIKDGTMLSVSVGGQSLELPAVVVPGQQPRTLGIAVGYGRTRAGRVANGIGQNVYPWVVIRNATRQYVLSGASVSPTGKEYEIAKAQTFIGSDLDEHTRHQIEERIEEGIVKEATLAAYLGNPSAGNENRQKQKNRNETLTLWDKHDYKGHHWAMAIDLNKCTGCGSCVVSCNMENNIPVVGKDEVRRQRDMAWLRIDRYFSGNPENADEIKTVFQPMLCQHCNNAPCESVCPVIATTHSDEGLNQMTYNRCVGTKYCANNCPYKVRRFNYFRYAENPDWDKNLHMNDSLGKLVLNPDVTVRSKGVMEKCSFCVQRIQESKLKAKVQMRTLADGETKTACQQSCPTGAIVFGDLNDPNSEIAKLFASPRAYSALEDVKTLPNVAYMTKVRNSNEEPKA